MCIRDRRGNSFIRAAMPDVFSTAEKWRYCDNYWVLPSDKTIEMCIRDSFYGIALNIVHIAHINNLRHFL